MQGHELDFTKLLSSHAPITWGQMLHLMPQGSLDKLMDAVKPETPAPDDTVPQEAVEIAAVHATVAAHLGGSTPENMFAPFTVPPTTESGGLTRAPDPVIHWGNVDTGSMVNIVYSGVVDTHVGLAQYKQEFTHVVRGVGDKTTKVVYKLVGVPISVGREQVPGSCRRATFYVLDCPTYHWILGLPLLSSIDAAVFCSSRTLQFKLGKAG